MRAWVLNSEIILQAVANKALIKLLTKAIHIFKLAVWNQYIDHPEANGHFFFFKITDPNDLMLTDQLFDRKT